MAFHQRLRLSALLLILVGLFSISSPGSLKSAHFHHRSPSSSSRTSRHLNRARANGSSRTSSEAEIEPEIVASSAILAAPPDHVPVVAAVLFEIHARAIKTIRQAYPLQEDPALALADAPLPHLGLAPPSRS